MTRFWHRPAKAGSLPAKAATAGLSLAVLALGGIAPALAGLGQPSPWQIGFQEPASPVADSLVSFHTMLVWIITIISLFVLALLAIIIVRFNERSNPTPSRTTHNTILEIAWTVIPVLILVVIAIPSFRLLKFQVEIPKPDLTIKAYGNQWYWSYEYPADQGGGFKFDSNMLSREDAQKAGQPALLAVDNEVVVPIDKVVAVQVIGNDVIHSFSVPSLAFRMDAIPGRLNQTWFKAEKEGIFYGQCSRLCGQNHAFMPIAIRVVSEQAYQDWLAKAKKQFASTGSGVTVAAANEPAAQ